MKRKTAYLLFAILALFTSCSVISGIASAYALKDCEYTYNSISDISVSDIDVSNGISLSVLPRLLTLLSGNASSLPLNFTVNVDVKNPNTQTAGFQKVAYIVNIDSIQFTTGAINEPFSIASGSTQTLPVNVGVDLITLVKENSASAIMNVVKNFIGIGTEPTNVSVSLKPTIKVGETASITSPAYIPVNFSFGGKK